MKQMVVAFAVALMFLMAGGCKQAPSPLTLETVQALSAKGEALSWEDFEGYMFDETGSGLYIRVYPIDEEYSLWIGGTGLEEPPMYIRLVRGLDTDQSVDIRTENVSDFLNLS